MKVLFLGAGLSHYYNQTLNRIHALPGVEVIDVFDSESTGHMGSEIFQTLEDVTFTVIRLKGYFSKKYSDFRYRNFKGLVEFLKKEKPEIIVAGDIYLYAFLQNANLHTLYRHLGIKLILRDIPFRTDTYLEAKRKIISGEMDNSYTPIPIVFLTSACSKLKLQKVATFLEKIIHRIGFTKLYRRMIGRKVLLRRLELKKELLNMVDAHIHYVEVGADIFATYGVSREKIFTTYNSPDTDILFNIKEKIEKETPILPRNPHRLIHLSRLAAWKRVDLLIEAVAKLQFTFPDIELLIIGSGPEENNLKNLAKKLGVENRVKFLGGIYDQELLGKYLISSSLYVLAGMGGLSINDAMTFGLPVICSVCDGTEKKLVYNGKNGLYFKDGNLDDMIEKIKMLFNNPKLLEKMGIESTRIIREEINIHTVIQGFIEAFNYVLQKIK